MLEDAQGLPVATDSAVTLAAIDRFTAAFLGYTRDADAILAGVAADPDCALAQALAGSLFLFLESPEAPGRARPFLDAAARLAAHADADERAEGYTAHALAWARQDIPGAVAALEAVVARHPEDLLALKLLHYHLFNLGQVGRMVTSALAARPVLAGRRWFHSLEAFALEEAQLLPQAERAAERALEIAPEDPWAHHALAHLHEAHGTIAAGRDRLLDWSRHWAPLNSFMLTHNWWHTALTLIDLGDTAGATALFHDRVWGVWKDYSQDQANAASLLARLEIALDAPGAPALAPAWSDLARHVAARGADTTLPFLTLHYVLALARGREAGALGILMEAIAAEAAAPPPGQERAWRRAVLPAADGLAAWAAGDWDEAADALTRAAPELWRVGGSHAQRDLFEQIRIDAVLRAGRLDEALQALGLRRLARPSSPFATGWHGRALRRLGLPQEEIL